MRPAAYKRNKFSAELYKSVRKTTGTSSSLSYYFVGNVAITAGLDTANRLTISCDQPIKIGSLLVNIRDSNNNLILDDTIWQITNLQPILNAFNTLDYYIMKAVKYQGTI